MGNLMRCPHVYKTVTCSPIETTLLGPGEERSVPVRFSALAGTGSWVFDVGRGRVALLISIFPAVSKEICKSGGVNWGEFGFWLSRSRQRAVRRQKGRGAA